MARTPPPLTRATLARRDAAMAQVRQWGDPSLRTEARPVGEVDDELRAEARRLVAIMDDCLGAGLAATQVGLLRRYFVYREGEVSEGSANALIDPTIEWQSDDTEVAVEGCLSLDGIWVPVERPAAVRMRGTDLSGHEVVINAHGPLARRIQHEYDHLDGVLMIDRAAKEDRKAALRALREGRPLPPPDDVQPDPAG